MFFCLGVLVFFWGPFRDSFFAGLIPGTLLLAVFMGNLFADDILFGSRYGSYVSLGINGVHVPSF